MIQRFRRIWRFLTPPWLQGEDGDGAKILFSLGLIKDAFVERARAGLEARLPSRAGVSANALTAGDRGILRGRAESNASFVARLLAWRSPRTHRVRGNAYEALQQIWRYWGGTYAATVDAHGLRHAIQVNGTDSRDTLASFINIAPGLCKWDNKSYSTNWARFWMVLQPQASFGIGPQPSFGDPALWGGSLGTEGYTLGQTGATPDDVLAMRKLFQDLNWHPGHTAPEWVLVPTESAVPAVPAPNGKWLHWSENFFGTQIATRAVTPRLFSFGTTAQQNGTGVLSVDMPDGSIGGELLLWHEVSNADADFDPPPTGWTEIATQGVFIWEGTSRHRLCAKIATASEPASVAYTITVGSGTDDHGVKITFVSAPPEGWNTNVLANFADIVTAADGAIFGHPSQIANPDNAGDRHRLNFVTAIWFDISQPTTTTGYEELYDSNGEINLALTTSTKQVTGSITSTTNGDLLLISVRLVYNVAWRFWSLDPAYNNTYAGNPANFPSAMTKVDDSGIHVGSSASFPATITLPDGKSYAGNPASYPTNIVLVDDGSIPR
jgi:hypothetical protein